VGFDGNAATAWRSLNYGLSKILEITEFSQSLTSTAIKICEALPADFATVSGKSSCVIPLTTVEIVIKTVYFAIQLVRCSIRHKFTQVACTISIIHAHHHRSVCT
jgi:hypothetical protein